MAKYFINKDGNYECPNITILWMKRAVCPDFKYVAAAQKAGCPKMVFRCHSRQGKAPNFTYPHYKDYEIDITKINMGNTMTYSKTLQVVIPLIDMIEIV